MTNSDRLRELREANFEAEESRSEYLRRTSTKAMSALLDHHPGPKRRLQDKAYVEWVRSQPCIVSCKPATVHHVRCNGGRRDDHRIVPLAPEYHLIQFGPKTSIEALGKRKFEALYGVDLEGEIVRHQKMYAEAGGVLRYAK